MAVLARVTFRDSCRSWHARADPPLGRGQRPSARIFCRVLGGRCGAQAGEELERQGRHHLARPAHRPGDRPGRRRAQRRTPLLGCGRSAAGPARRRADRPPGRGVLRIPATDRDPSAAITRLRHGWQLGHCVAARAVPERHPWSVLATDGRPGRTSRWRQGGLTSAGRLMTARRTGRGRRHRSCRRGATRGCRPRGNWCGSGALWPARPGPPRPRRRGA